MQIRKRGFFFGELLPVVIKFAAKKKEPINEVELHAFPMGS